MQYYTVYRGEEIVAFGSSTQCAKKLGFKSKNSFYALISRSKSGIRAQHYEKEGSDTDRKREHFLSDLGIHVLRFSNLDVNRNFNGVCEEILKYL